MVTHSSHCGRKCPLRGLPSSGDTLLTVLVCWLVGHAQEMLRMVEKDLGSAMDKASTHPAVLLLQSLVLFVFLNSRLKRVLDIGNLGRGETVMESGGQKWVYTVACVLGWPSGFCQPVPTGSICLL